jgi:macrolide-specific efflux system membrane fusion protein
VKKSGGANFVYVIEKGKLVRRKVQTGWKQGRFLEITEGLKEGDEVLEDHRDQKGGES